MMIKVQSHIYGLRVLIDDIIHVFIAGKDNTSSIQAVHAWQDDETHFFIDYYLTQGSIIHCEYDTRQK